MWECAHADSFFLSVFVLSINCFSSKVHKTTPHSFVKCHVQIFLCLAFLLSVFVHCKVVLYNFPHMASVKVQVVQCCICWSFQCFSHCSLNAWSEFVIINILSDIKFTAAIFILLCRSFPGLMIIVIA